MLWSIETINGRPEIKQAREWPWLWQPSAVVHVSSSPDGRYFVTSSEDGISKMYDLRRINAPPRELRHPANVFSSAFSPDGLLIATACRDRKVRVWDCRTKEIVNSLECGGTPGQIAFVDDGLRLFAQGGDDRAILWRLRTEGTSPVTLRTEATEWKADLAANNRHVLTVSKQATQLDGARVQVWNVVGTEVPTHFWGSDIVLGEIKEPVSAALSSNGNCVALCGNGKVILSKPGGGPSKSFDNFGMFVMHSCFSPDESRFMAVGSDETRPKGIARIWRVDEGHEGELVTTFEGHEAPILYAGFSPNGKLVLSCGGDFNRLAGEANVWNVDEKPDAPLVHKLGGHIEPVLYGEFSRDGRFVVTTSADDTASVWSVDPSVGKNALKTLRSLQTKEAHTADVVFAAFAPDDTDQIVTVGKDGRAILWDWKNPNPLWFVLDHGRPLKQVVFSRNGRHFLTVTEGNAAYVWDRIAAAADSIRRVPPLIAVLEHSGQLVTAGIHPDDDTKFLTVSYVETASAMSSQGMVPEINMPMSDGGKSERTRSVQLKVWDIGPIHHEPAAANIIGVLAQRGVNLNSQTLETLPLNEISKLIGDPNVEHSKTLSAAALEKRWELWNRGEADTAEATGEWYAATWHLSQLISLPIEAPELRIRRARCYAKHEWHQEAIDDWDKLLANEEKPSVVDQQREAAFTGRAASYKALAERGLKENDEIKKDDSMRIEQAQKALADYEKVITPDSQQVELVIARAEIYSRLGNRDAAIRDYSAAIDKLTPTGVRNGLSDLLRKRARIYRKIDRLQEAVVDFQKAAEGFEKSNNLSAALATYTEGIGPDNQLDYTKAPLLAGRGRIQLNPWRSRRTGRVEMDAKGAIRDFMSALKFNDDWTLHWDLAKAYHFAENAAEAEQYYKSAIERTQNQMIDASLVQPLYWEFVQFYKQKGDWAGAASILSAAIDSSSDVNDRLRLLQERAMVHEHSREWGLARKDYDTVIALQPNDPLLLTRRAATFAEQSMWKDAEADLTRSCELLFAKSDLNYEDVVRSLNRLADVRLTVGDTGGYQECCKKLIGNYRAEVSSNRVGSNPNLIAWTLALGSDSGIPAADATKIAKDAVGNSRDEESVHNTLRTAYYREHNYDAVLKSWNESSIRMSRDGGQSMKPLSEDCFILAMTNHQIHKKAEAQEWLKLGVESLEQAEKEVSSKISSFTDGMQIWQRLEQRLLRREAEQLLRSEDAVQP